MILLALDGNQVVENENEMMEALKMNQSRVNKKLKLGLKKRTSAR